MKLRYFKKTKSDNTEVFLLLGRERQSHLLVKYITLGVRFVVILSLSRVQLFATPWAVAHQALLSLGFSSQEYWSELPFPSQRDLPDSGIRPVSPALAGGFFTTEPPEKPMAFNLYLL